MSFNCALSTTLELGGVGGFALGATGGAFLSQGPLCSWQQDQVRFTVSLACDWRLISVSILERQASLAESWLIQDKDSTRHPLSPWLGGIFKATKPFPTRVLPLNTQCGLPLGQHGKSSPGPHITTSWLFIYFLIKNGALILPLTLPYSSAPPHSSPAYSCVPPKSWEIRSNRYHSLPTCPFSPAGQSPTMLWHQSSQGHTLCALMKQK